MSRRRKANPTKLPENAKKLAKEVENSQEENEDKMLLQPQTPSIIIPDHKRHPLLLFFIIPLCLAPPHGVTDRGSGVTLVLDKSVRVIRRVACGRSD
uniref:Uncharacterized protein n=1 Tax=Caenorhabditis tropicalis TaxID=1561998 RepID=A0A1I7TJQ7_9PELO